MTTRYCAVAIIHDDKNNIFICKKPKNRGVYPGQWALPGGGIGPNENMIDALKREVREETGLEIDKIKPYTFTDDRQKKHHKDGTIKELYMVYLIFDCKATTKDVVLDDEHEEYDWVQTSDLNQYDLNPATIKTFKQKGWV